MGGGLTHQDEVEALLQGERAERLLALEIITQQGHGMRGERRGMVAEPTCAGGLLTILCVMPILRHDICRWQGKHVGGVGTHHDRRNRRVIIQRLPMRERSREAIGTMDGLGGNILGAIKGNP
jgi:hypothetical protein